MEKLIDDNNFVLNNGQPTYTHHNGYYGSHAHLDLSLICHTFSTKTCWEVLNDTFGTQYLLKISTTVKSLFCQKLTGNRLKFTHEIY